MPAHNRAMIIDSLLDTDLYKFTMMQAVLHQHPGAQVEYRFKCRTPGIDLAQFLQQISDEIDALCALRFRAEELDYLRGLRFIKPDFADFLALFHLDRKYLQLQASSTVPGEIELSIRGPWLHTILFEVPILAIVSEVYFRNTRPRPDFDEGRRRLSAKGHRQDAANENCDSSHRNLLCRMSRLQCIYDAPNRRLVRT